MPGAASTPTESISPGRCSQRWTSENGASMTVAPPIEDTSPNLKIPTIVTGSRPAWVLILAFDGIVMS